jgi:hypothetical protein
VDLLGVNADTFADAKSWMDDWRSMAGFSRAASPKLEIDTSELSDVVCQWKRTR